MLRYWFQLGASIVLLSLYACIGPDDDEPDYSVLPRDLTPEEQELTQAADRFGLKLFREVVSQDVDGGNIFISPLSVSMALGMTANGAADSTLNAMRATLELDALTEEESNQAYQGLIELLLAADPEVRFDLANSIWTREGWTFLADFLQRCQDYFDAEVRSEDFADPATVDLINSWIEEQTNGKIKDMLDVIPTDAVMYLINAIYFKGTWMYEFDAAKTVDDEFTLVDGSPAPIRMMNQEADLLYHSDEHIQMVDLPYGDGLFRMTVLLPKTDVHVDSVAAMLTTDSWAGWIGHLDTAGIALELPRFKFQYKLKMNDVLKSLGMSVAFDGSNADFTRMRTEGGLFISRVLHQSFVQVDEEGTEAAAATIVEMMWTSVPSYQSFRVDRPFIFVIREHTSGAMLFMGKVMQPVWEE
ncbi:MAG: serpin family protein [Candidatus Marinimicrobia bacterium]|nr:serpin family protein [Candidatus Neomarinimicrobiota bacterium]